MPIVSELQRDRVALLLTLNVLFFVAYAASVVILVASPSIWLVAFLVLGLAYNVIELWLSSPYKQPPDVVIARGKSASASGAGRASRRGSQPLSPPLSQPLGRMHRAEPVLGTRGLDIGRESLSQRLSELNAELPSPRSSIIEAAVSTTEPSASTQDRVISAQTIAEQPTNPVPTAEAEITGIDEIIPAGTLVSTEVVANLMVTSSVDAANDPELLAAPVDEPPFEQILGEELVEDTLSQAPIVEPVFHAMVLVEAGDSISAPAELALPDVVIVQMSEPVVETAAEEAVLAAPQAGVETGLATTPPSAVKVVTEVGQDETPEVASTQAAVVDTGKLRSTEPAIKPVTTPSTQPAIQPITHVAGRRQDVVDIVIASLASESVREAPKTRPASKPASGQQAGAGRSRTPSESLAMLRSELAKSRGNSRETAHGGAPVSPRKPIGAGRKPVKSPADGTRDRVMFVWHGRHFLAPIEGRHPLRVAQSLYDFMVEEAMEQG